MSSSSFKPQFFPKTPPTFPDLSLYVSIGEEGGAGGEDADPEAECKTQYKPVVQLDEVETKSGEEEEAILYDCKCKLYRYNPETNEWKERGVGPVRILQHKESKRIRLLMREEKTLKIRANHMIIPGTKL